VARALHSRKWRRRGRRGQVAAVATLLGLLLVVTFIANFLTTVVPNQMQVNDLNHDIQLENEYGRLAALLASAGSQGAPGMQFVQPLTLGSQSVAPWTGQDGSTVGSGRVGSSVSLSFGLLGATIYLPPTGSPQGGPALPSACAFTSGADVGISCTGTIATTLAYNFSGNSKAFTLSDTGTSNLISLNYSTNSSTIALSLTGTVNLQVAVYGSNDHITTTGVGSGTMIFVLVGNNDYVNLDGTGNAAVQVYLYGTHDNVYQSAVGSGSLLLVEYGTQDSFTGNATGSETYRAYVTGFNATNPNSTQCPYSNQSSTDKLSGSTVGGGPFIAYYNNTIYTGSKTVSPWTTHYQQVGASLCPFFAPQQIPLESPAVVGTGPVTELINSYAPSGEIAYDEGAVVYAQYGAYPVFLQNPSIALTVLGGAGGNVTDASIWLPLFSNLVGSVAGVGTETLDLGLLQTERYVINETSSEFAVNPNVPITIVVQSVYAEAWDAFLTSHPSFAGLWTCAPAPVCTGVYNQGGRFGTVTITIPTTNLQLLSIGSSIFSLSLS
jgi:hypothetical protein